MQIGVERIGCRKYKFIFRGAACARNVPWLSLLLAAAQGGHRAPRSPSPLLGHCSLYETIRGQKSSLKRMGLLKAQLQWACWGGGVWEGSVVMETLEESFLPINSLFKNSRAG